MFFETFEFCFVLGVFVNDSPEGRAAWGKSDKDLNLLTFFSRYFKVCLEIVGIFKEPISKHVLETMDVIEFIYNTTVLYRLMISCTIKKQSVQQKGERFSLIHWSEENAHPREVLREKNVILHQGKFAIFILCVRFLDRI